MGYCREFFEALSFEGFNLQLPSANVAEARNRRRRKWHHERIGDRAHLRHGAQQDRSDVSGKHITLIPILQHNDEQARVGLQRAREEVEPVDLNDIGDVFVFSRHRLKLIRDLLCAQEIRRWWKLEDDEVVALIFVGNERGRRDSEVVRDTEASEDEHGNHAVPVLAQPTDEQCVMRRHEIEATIEEHERQELRGLLFAKEHAAECGRKRQRIHRAERNRERNSECELVVELSGDAGHQCGGDKHCEQHGTSRNNRTADLLHRHFSCEFRIFNTTFKLPVNIFDNDDRVIDDQADREHESEQRERVDGESEDRHHRERADDRHWNRDHRNERGAEGLQEHVDRDEDQDAGFDEGLDEIIKRRLHKLRRVVGDLVLKVGRELRLESLHRELGLVHNIKRVGGGQLIQRDSRRCARVERGRT